MNKHSVLLPKETVLSVPGLSRKLTLLHVTDLHLTDIDERDPEALTYLDRYCNLFDELLPKDSPYPVTRQIYLEQIVQLANERNVDAVVFTGDIMHYPSKACLELLSNGLKNLRAPYLYTLGNHDWHFPHLPWTVETRSEYYSSFKPFIHGDPSIQVKEIAGLRFIAVDNSDYQIDDQQLKEIKALMASSVPCLLFMHIPIYLPELVKKTIDKWNAPILMSAEGWNEELLKKWKLQGTNESTREFYELILANESKSLYGIFSGHVHFDHEERVAGDVLQYVTMPGYEGCVRIVEIG